MFSYFAMVWAGISYRWELLVGAGKADVSAALSVNLATEKRNLVDQLNKQADDIEKRIAEVAAMEENGFWECENGHEKPSIHGDFGGKDVAVDSPCPACGMPTKFISRDAMTGQEKYESDKERGEAEKIVADKRTQAKAEADNAENSEKTAKYFRDQAANGRQVAEKIRNI
jgi:hypothetical protein